jgi:hypothetical protein
VSRLGVGLRRIFDGGEGNAVKKAIQWGTKSSGEEGDTAEEIQWRRQTGTRKPYSPWSLSEALGEIADDPRWK